MKIEPLRRSNLGIMLPQKNTWPTNTLLFKKACAVQEGKYVSLLVDLLEGVMTAMKAEQDADKIILAYTNSDHVLSTSYALALSMANPEDRRLLEQMNQMAQNALPLKRHLDTTVLEILNGTFTGHTTPPASPAPRESPVLPLRAPFSTLKLTATRDPE